MAWNKPIEKKVERRGGKALIAGLVVVLVGGLVVWLFSGGEKRPTRATKETSAPTQIAEVKPQIVTNAVALAEGKAAKKPVSEMTDAEKLADIRAKYGNNIPENLKQVVYFLENPPKREFKAPPRPSHIFKRSSERQIAEFMMVDPGDWMLRNKMLTEKGIKPLSMPNMMFRQAVLKMKAEKENNK